MDTLDRAIKNLDYQTWTSAYKDIEFIMSRYYPNINKIEQEVEKWFKSHKNDRYAQIAYNHYKNS